MLYHEQFVPTIFSVARQQQNDFSPEDHKQYELSLLQNQLFNPQIDIAALEKITQESIPQLIYFDSKLQQFRLLASANNNDKSRSLYGSDSVFGRDSFQMEHAFLDAQKWGMNVEISDASKLAVLELYNFQAKIDDPTRGIKAGQLLHEFKFTNHDLLRAAGWFYNEEEDRVENHDSADATLWCLIDTTNIAKTNPELVRGYRTNILLAANYLFGNSIEHDYLNGFTNDKNNGIRLSDGIDHRGWKDSHDSVLFDNGLRPKDGHPVDLPEVTALAFVAELQTADWLEKEARENKYLSQDEKQENLTLAEKLRTDAFLKKVQFNDPVNGFARYENGKVVYVEARGVNPETGKREQLPGISSDIVFALRLPYISNDENGNTKVQYIIDSQNIPDVINTIQEELFIPNMGLATYSHKRFIVESKSRYHRSRGKTFWTDKGYMAANALIDLGLHVGNIQYIRQGIEIGDTAGDAVLEFGSPLELYVDNNGKREEWKNPENKITFVDMQEGKEIVVTAEQKGCKIQGWVVAEQAAFLARRSALKKAFEGSLQLVA